MKKAVVEYRPNNFVIVGPTELVGACRAVQTTAFFLSPQKYHALLNDIYKDWYVECGVTGDPISLADLHYWCVDTQQAFKDVQVAFEYNSGRRIMVVS